MIYFTVGAAITVAVLVALFKPGAAEAFLSKWRRYKQVFLFAIGTISTFYFLSSGVWYLVLLGGAGVVAAVWAVWFSDIGMGWAR